MFFKDLHYKLDQYTFNIKINNEILVTQTLLNYLRPRPLDYLQAKVNDSMKIAFSTEYKNKIQNFFNTHKQYPDTFYMEYILLYNSSPNDLHHYIKYNLLEYKSKLAGWKELIDEFIEKYIHSLLIVLDYTPMIFTWTPLALNIKYFRKFTRIMYPLECNVYINPLSKDTKTTIYYKDNKYCTVLPLAKEFKLSTYNFTYNTVDILNYYILPIVKRSPNISLYNTAYNAHAYKLSRTLYKAYNIYEFVAITFSACIDKVVNILANTNYNLEYVKSILPNIVTELSERYSPILCTQFLNDIVHRYAIQHFDLIVWSKFYFNDMSNMATLLSTTKTESLCNTFLLENFTDIEE